jgi:PAS domain S-box-containing protein
MNDAKKTREQLIAELAEACARIAELEASEAELKGAEEALQVSEERFALALRGSNDGIWDWDMQRGSLYWSPRFKELLGYASDELEAVFETFESHLHPDDRERIGAAIEAHLKDRVPYDVEERLRTKSGEYRWFHARGQALWDEAGKPIRMAGSITDITEQKEAEEALRASEERFTLAVRGSNDGVWDWDIQNNTLYWSPRLKELLGYADDELDIDFDTFDSLLHPDDKEHIGAAIEAHLKDRVPYDVEERQRTKSGEYRWFRVRGQAIWGEDGQPLRMAGSTTDITELKQAQEALRKAYKEVEKQVEERTAELQRETAERERLQQEVIEAQRRALRELSTPIIPVTDRVIVMPLIGSIDTLRAKDIMRALLAGIREHRAKVVILDITGVPIVDSGVANHLNKTIQAARLKGAQTIVTGIADAVAEAIVDLGIDWSGIETLSDLQTGLMAALSSLGIEPTRWR